MRSRLLYKFLHRRTTFDDYVLIWCLTLQNINDKGMKKNSFFFIYFSSLQMRYFWKKCQCETSSLFVYQCIWVCVVHDLVYLVGGFLIEVSFPKAISACAALALASRILVLLYFVYVYFCICVFLYLCICVFVYWSRSELSEGNISLCCFGIHLQDLISAPQPGYRIIISFRTIKILLHYFYLLATKQQLCRCHSHPSSTKDKE